MQTGAVASSTAKESGLFIDGLFGEFPVMKNILLLTATITPPSGVPDLRRTSPLHRMADYRRALEFYCELPETIITHIVFVENSGTDISPLREVVLKRHASHRVEFVTFNGLDYPSNYGRGYGEFKLMDYAVGHSDILRSAQSHDRLWKVTGRYRVLNLPKLLKTAPAQFELYCDRRGPGCLNRFSASISGSVCRG